MERLARVGLGAKGFVYTLIGILAFMAAFEIAGQSNDDADRNGVMKTLRDFPGGNILLALLIFGLVCYSAWRMVEAFGMEKDLKRKLKKRIRYFLSALTYLSVAFAAWQIMMYQSDGGSDGHWSAQFMNKDLGKIILGGVALVMAGIGVYQIWYGFSEKYKKRFAGGALRRSRASVLLRSGKIGYASRGVVWLIISYMLLKAVWEARASEAGDTAKAFSFIESSSYGSYLLGALGLGLVAFGIFNFLRAAYEDF